MSFRFLSLRRIAALAVIGASTIQSANAADLSLDNINLADYDALVKEFSANSMYSTVTPASSLGGLWGFELGALAHMTIADDTLALVKRNNASTSFQNKLYHAGALLRVGLPYGFTGELVYLPKLKFGGVSVGRWGIGAQWTITDAILEDFPVNLAVKGYYTKTTLTYSQTVNNASTSGAAVTANIGLDNSLWGVMALLSYKIFILEPYVGIGYVKAKGTLNVDAAGSVTILNTTFFGANAKSAQSSPSSAQFQIGSDLRLAFFTLGAEYAKVFDKNTYTARLGFRF
jgi:hypothetical protein